MVNTLKLAEALYEAEKTQTTISPLTETDPDITIDEAYEIQLHNVKKYLDSGDKIVGKKIGLTAVAVQQALGVNEPDYGHLYASMLVEDGGVIDSRELIQPKIEGEIAFVLKEDLVGPKVSALDVIRATDYLLPAIEIVDSRVRNWEIKLADTVSDNASSARLVLGTRPTKVTEVDLPLVGQAVYKNGELINTGTGAAALGNPAICVAWLANKLFTYGIELKAGEIILSGALSAMVEVTGKDHFTCSLAHLGKVEVVFA